MNVLVLRKYTLKYEVFKSKGAGCLQLTFKQFRKEMMYGWMDGWMDRDDRYRERQMQEMLQQMWQNEHLVNLGDR